MLEVERLQDDLADDKICKLFLQLDFVEKLHKIALIDCPLSVAFAVESSEYMLMIIGD